MTATEKLEAYLKPVLEGLDGIVYVQFSDGDSVDRAKSDSVSMPIFPGVFVIAPEYVVKDNGFGEIIAEFEVGMYFLEHIDIESYADEQPGWQDQEDCYNRAEATTLDAYQKLRHDNDLVPAPVHFKGSPWKSERISQVTNDNAMGYLVTTRLGIPASEIFC